jgi:pilus assembly protein CpaB
MFKRRGLMLVVVSLALALGAATLARNWLTAQMSAAAKARPAGTGVVVATMEIPFGIKVEGRHVRLIELPSGAAPAGHFTKTEDVVGQIATQKVLPGEVLIEERFSKHMGGSTLAAIIKPNMRAVTVRVNDVVGVAGFLLPGNHVDVVSARMVDKRAATETILRDINVLAVDQKARTEKDEPVVVRAVTLEVTPQQAETLVKAREEGEIQLTLRNPLEEDPTVVVQEAPKPPPKVVRVYRRQPVVEEKVTIIRGTNVDTSKAGT